MVVKGIRIVRREEEEEEEEVVEVVVEKEENKRPRGLVSKHWHARPFTPADERTRGRKRGKKGSRYVKSYYNTTQVRKKGEIRIDFKVFNTHISNDLTIRRRVIFTRKNYKENLWRFRSISFEICGTACWRCIIVPKN